MYNKEKQNTVIVFMFQLTTLPDDTCMTLSKKLYSSMINNKNGKK